MKYTWKNVSVFQYQQLMEAWKEKDATNLDILVRTVSIVTGLTEHEVDSLGIDKLNSLGEHVAFVHEKIEPQAAKYIKVNGRRYRCLYDIRQMPCARYIESSVFAADPIANLHKLAATLVMPQKRFCGFLWWVDDKYNAARHADYAQDMLSAPIMSVLGSVLFFCEVYLHATWNIADFSIPTDKTQMMTQKIAKQAVQDLCNNMVGIYKSSWSLGSRVYPWEKPTT